MTDWQDLVARLGLKRQGAQWRGPCPLHGGKNTSSFTISPTCEAFHCFACGEGGSLNHLRALLGVAPIEIPPSLRIPDVPQPLHVRPLGPLDPTHRYFAERGIHAATARFFGAGYFQGAPPFGGRVVIPLHDARGRLHGHLGRATGEEEPRYLFQRGVERHRLLFNFHRLGSDVSDVVVVEGVFDLFSVHQLGVRNVVATLGCETSDEQRAMLRRFKTVYILFDGDASGHDAARELATDLGARAVVLSLPKADPCAMKGVVLTHLFRAHEIVTE